MCDREKQKIGLPIPSMFNVFLLKKNSRLEPKILHFGQSMGGIWILLKPVPELFTFQLVDGTIVWKLRCIFTVYFLR